MAKHAHCACSTSQQPKPKGAKPNLTPLTHTRSFSASRHPRLLALLVCLPQELACSPILPKAPAIADIHQNPQPSTPPDPAFDSCGSAKAPGSLRLVPRHGGAPSGSGRMQIQQQHPRSAPLCPLSRSTTGRKGREGGGTPDGCSSPAKDQRRKTWAPGLRLRRRSLSRRQDTGRAHASRGERSNGEQKAEP